jgi:hypothetical protein
MSDISQLLSKSAAKNAAQLVADAAQAQLMRSKQRLSGDDSNLQNTWEEICVQVRGEQSYFWDAYESAMRDAVLGVLQFLSWNVMETLWLHTDDGWDLRYDMDADETEGRTSQPGYERPDIAVDEEVIAQDIITNYLLPLAGNFTNPRVEEFLYPGCDDPYGVDDESDSDNDEQEEEQTPIKPFDIKYYDDTWDSSNYLACFNRHYICAIRPSDPEPKWEFLSTNGAQWDAVHQRVYRNFGAECIDKDQLPASLPPLPTEVPLEVMNPPPPPPKLIPTADFPVVTKYLHDCEGRGTAVIHLVLYEDIYESTNGDGVFHYPEIAFFDLEAAKNYEGDKSGCYRYHIRPGLIWLDGETIGCEMPRRLFDHFTNSEVLQLATKAIERTSSAG